MATRIIRNDEAVQYGLLGLNTGLKAIDVHVASFEQHFALAVLGMPFYEILLADVVDADLNAVEWKNGDSYDTDDVVYFAGTTFKSTTDGNTAPPPGGNWVFSTRFDDAEYQEFWEKHLLGYFAAAISTRVFAFLPAVGSNGLEMKESTDESPSRSATKAERAERLNSIKQAAYDKLQLLMYYVHRKKEEGSTKYDTCRIVADPSAVRKFFQAPRRRFHFRTDVINPGLDRAKYDYDTDYPDS